MGTYIVQADIESQFGTSNVAAWSNLSNTSTSADTDRIADAIDYAERTVESRLRGRGYTIPLSASSSGALTPVIDWCAKLAGVWLYESRGQRDSAEGSDEDKNRVRFHKADVNKEIDAVVAGCRRLDLVQSHSPMPTGPVVC